MAILTPAELRDWIPGLSGTGQDTLLATLIARADALLAGWLGYPPVSAGTAPTIEDATYTLFLPGPGGRRLILPVAPALSITSIEDDTQEEFDGVSELVASTDYVLRDETGNGNAGVVLLTVDSVHGAWSATAARVIKVVGIFGFTAIPEPLKHAAILIAAHTYQQRATVGRQSIPSPTGGTIQPRSEALPEEAMTYAAPYRLWYRWVQ